MSSDNFAQQAPRAFNETSLLAIQSAEKTALLENQQEQGEARQALWDLEAAGRGQRAQAALRLSKLGLVGRPITFEGGHALGTVRYTAHGDEFVVHKDHELSGVEGIVSASQADEDGDLLLDVYTPGKLFQWPPQLPHTYRVVARFAQFSIGPNPTAE